MKNECLYEIERGKTSSIIFDKVVQKIKYDRLFLWFSFTRIIVVDGTLASIQLEFQITIIAKKVLITIFVFTLRHDGICPHHILYMTFFHRQALIFFFFLLAHLVMINIIVSFNDFSSI
jgi:hypothetical protein